MILNKLSHLIKLKRKILKISGVLIIIFLILVFPAKFFTNKEKNLKGQNKSISNYLNTSVWPINNLAKIANNFYKNKDYSISASSTNSKPQNNTNSEISPILITAKSLIALNCYAKSNNLTITQKYGDSRGDIKWMLGSGVLINPQGYILTARHIVDPQWEVSSYGTFLSAKERKLDSQLIFDYCEVSFPIDDTNLPTTKQIRTQDPHIKLTRPFPYIATLYFTPSKENLSGYLHIFE